jgi:hypothetical protein
VLPDESEACFDLGVVGAAVGVVEVGVSGIASFEAGVAAAGAVVESPGALVFVTFGALGPPAGAELGAADPSVVGVF